MKVDFEGPREFDVTIKASVAPNRDLVVSVVFPDWLNDPKLKKAVGDAIHIAHDQFRAQR